MSWNNLKAAIAAAIRTNNNQEITGDILQNTLNSIVDNVGANATFAGVATPSTSPGTPDGPVFWIAGTPGIYSNFNNAQVRNEQLSVFVWNNPTWTSHVVLDVSTLRNLISGLERIIRGVGGDASAGYYALLDLGDTTSQTGVNELLDAAYMATDVTKYNGILRLRRNGVSIIVSQHIVNASQGYWAQAVCGKVVSSADGQILEQSESWNICWRTKNYFGTDTGWKTYGSASDLHLKTINGQSIVGDGNIEITASGQIDIDDIVNPNSGNAVSGHAVAAAIGEVSSSLNASISNVTNNLNALSNSVSALSTDYTAHKTEINTRLEALEKATGKGIATFDRFIEGSQIPSTIEGDETIVVDAVYYVAIATRFYGIRNGRYYEVWKDYEKYVNTDNLNRPQRDTLYVILGDNIISYIWDNEEIRLREYSAGSSGAVPDEEDITTLNGLLKFKDKAYESISFSGLGRVYLRKNIVDFQNILTQAMLSQANTIYHIQYNYDLNGATVTIPTGSVLHFDGGKIQNGTIVLQDTLIDGNVRFAANVTFNGTCKNQSAYQSWFENNDVDAWHRFMRSVYGPVVYDYTEGEYTVTEYMRKDVDECVIINGNGAKLIHPYQSSESYEQPFFRLRPRQNEQTFELPRVVHEGDFEIYVGSNIENFSVGDIIMLRDTAPYSFCPERSYYNRGEFAKVVNADTYTQTIAIDHAAYDNYDHIGSYYNESGTLINENACTISIIKVIRVEMSELLFEQPAPSMSTFSAGIMIEKATGFVRNCRSENFLIGMLLHNDYFLNVIGGEFSASGEGSMNVSPYGVHISNCQNILVDNARLHVKSGNHAISIGGNTVDNIISRHISIANCVAKHLTSGSASIDAHRNSEYITVKDCYASKIYLFVANNASVEGCKVDEDLNVDSFKRDNVTIRQNTVGGSINYSNAAGGDEWILNYDREGYYDSEIVIDSNSCGGIISLQMQGGKYRNSDKDLTGLHVIISRNICKGIRAIACINKNDDGTFLPEANLPISKGASLAIQDNILATEVRYEIHARIVDLSGNVYKIPYQTQNDALVNIRCIHGNIINNKATYLSEEGNALQLFSLRSQPESLNVENNVVDKISLVNMYTSIKESANSIVRVRNNIMTKMAWANLFFYIYQDSNALVFIENNYYPDKTITGSNTRTNAFSVQTHVALLFEAHNYRGNSLILSTCTAADTHIIANDDVRNSGELSVRELATNANTAAVAAQTTANTALNGLTGKVDKSTIWQGTQSEYDALPSATKASIIAFITED